MYEASAEYGRRGGFHRRENVGKQCKTGEKRCFWRQNEPLQLKIHTLMKTLNFKLLFALLTPNIIFEALRSMGE